MPNNINQNQFNIIAITFFACAMLLSNNIGLGGNPVEREEYTVNVRVLVSSTSGVRIDLIFKIYGKCYYASRENDGTTWDNAKYTTSKHDHNTNPRYLSHYGEEALKYPDKETLRYKRAPNSPSFTTTLNRTGIIDSVNKYWEYHLYKRSTYTPVSDATPPVAVPSPSQNCHGYSTGKGVFMVSDSFMKLMKDDWKEYELVADLPEGGGAVYGNDSHSIRIDEVTLDLDASDPKYTVTISEKFRDSGVYKSSYTKKVSLDAEVKLDLKNLKETVIFVIFTKN